MRIDSQYTPQTSASAPRPETPPPGGLRHDWTLGEIEALFALPFTDLMFQAQTIHRAHFDANAVQLLTLLSIKTGGCPEDCGYCAQSVHYDTPVKAGKFMAVEAVLAEARRAKEAGSTRYCLGAAWRGPKDRDLEVVCDMIKGVRDLGMESCLTLGMLTPDQATRLHDVGLDYYNHNIDTSAEFYGEVITTRTYQDRLDTLEYVRNAGINVCCGGIVGMGESRRDRAGMLLTLVNLPQHPQSVPINMLMKVTGTPASEADDLDQFEFVRTIAVARITMPESVVRLSAGRESMNDQTQALCFMAGANSIFIGPKLLTTGNPAVDHDAALFDRLGLRPLA